MDSSQIVAFGGYPGNDALEYVFELAGGRKVLVDHTASPELAGPELDADVTHLRFYPWPPAELRALALAQDVIMIGGGNTANMLAVWRVHGFDAVLREAWEGGVVLTGWSAGLICWFEAGVTDSFGPQLAGLRDGLGFLPGSACPHYDGEERRRPVYEELVRGGFPPGIALDDAAGAHYVGTELSRVLATTPTATGYLVARDGEQRLEAQVI
jgi:peptidase E